MNEQDLTNLMEQATARIPDKAVPLDLITSGTEHQRKPRAALVLAGVAAVTALGVIAVVATERTLDGARSEVTSPLTPSPVDWEPIPVPSPTPTLPAALQRGGPIEVELKVEDVVPGTALSFIVRLTNDSPDPVSMNVCPPYRLGLATTIDTGMLNCADGPDSIAPHDYVDYAMQVGAPSWLRKIAYTQVVWELGSEGDEGPNAIDENVPVVLPPGQLSSVEVIQSPSYPEYASLPLTVAVRDTLVNRDLACPIDAQTDGALMWKQGPRSDVSAALWLSKPGSVWAAVLVRQSPNRGTVLLLDREKQTIGTAELNRSGNRWYAGDFLRCSSS